MDEDTSMPISENPNPFQGTSSVVDNDEDRISNLSDTLLEYILSFLETRYALRTSLLSTRWKYLWTHVPNLEFEDWDYHTPRQLDDRQFVKFVDNVLVFHESEKIKRFRLLCHQMECTATHINAWVSTAIRRNVEELHLIINIEVEFFLPYSLFSCESLEILHIEAYYDLQPLTSVCLPSLRNLYLYGVTFSDDNSAQQFFSGCPVLEELTVFESAWQNLNVANISFSALKNLEVQCGGFVLQVLDTQVNISAENLVSFKYDGSLSYKYSLCNLSSIVDANFSVIGAHYPGAQEEVGSRTCELLRDFSGVEALTITKETIEALADAEEDLLADLPTFCKLTYFKVEGGFEYNYCHETLIDLLQVFPNLETLVFSNVQTLIYVQGGPDLQCEDHNWMLKPVPQCFVCSLKEIEFGKVYGMEHELCLVSFLLKNAVVLKKLNIVWYENLLEDLEKQATIREQVLMFPRGSSNCVITFS